MRTWFKTIERPLDLGAGVQYGGVAVVPGEVGGDRIAAVCRAEPEVVGRDRANLHYLQRVAEIELLEGGHFGSVLGAAHTPNE